MQLFKINSYDLFTQLILHLTLLQPYIQPLEGNYLSLLAKLNPKYDLVSCLLSVIRNFCHSGPMRAGMFQIPHCRIEFWHQRTRFMLPDTFFHVSQVLFHC